MVTETTSVSGSRDGTRIKVALIGGSAGSLAAIESLMETLSSDCGIAYVVVQHQTPGHESLLHALIAKCTPLPVLPVVAGLALRPNHVYVAQPGQFLGLAGGALQVASAPAPSSRDRHRPIDYFCQELATGCGSGAALVILSGTLDDGSRGATVINQAGGLVLAQAPETALFPDMPENALELGHVDRVLSPAGIAAALCAWGRTGSLDSEIHSERISVEEEERLAAIIRLAQDASHTDLSGYKPTTLSRRIQRRARLVQASDLRDYLRLLQDDKSELERLSKDLLIGVTAFFRDDGAFAVLATEAIPTLLADKTPSDALRVWVAGCSTGEEAYSITMTLMEGCEAQPTAPRLQVFGTDIDHASLEIARAGWYDETAMQGVSEERRGRFFTTDRGGWRIAKSVRERIVFAAHNLTSDPPFSRLDLLVCRNLLIYLNAETQKRLLNLFRFVLNPGGYLFLGCAESLGSLGGEFQTVSSQWRLYRQPADASRQPLPSFPLGLAARRPPLPSESAPDVYSLAGREQIGRQLLERYGRAQLLVDEHGEVFYVSGHTTPYLTVPPGPSSHDLLKMVKPGLTMALRSAINQAHRTQSRATLSALPAPSVAASADGSGTAVRIEVEPIADPMAPGVLLVCLGPEAGAADVLPQVGGNGDDWVLRQLEMELEVTREDLERTIGQARASSQEMKAANEEVMAMNEELQSANEELESAKEELQSLNEELSSTNITLETNIKEVEALNSDLSNLLVSTETATLLLDAELRIRRFTPACAQLMHVIATDIGRAVEDLVRQVDDPELVDDCRRVLTGEAVPEREIRDEAHRWYLRRMHPYRSSESATGGVVLTYTEISALKEAGALLEERAAALQWQANLLSRAAPVVGRDLEDRIIFWNRGAELLYGWSAADAHGQVTHSLLETRFPEPLETLKAQVLDRGLWKGELTHRCADGREVIVDSQWTLYRDEAGEACAIVEVNNDITERTLAEREVAHYRDHLEALVAQRTADLQAAEERIRLILDASGDGLYGIDAEGRLTFINAAACAMLGYRAEALLGRRIHGIIHRAHADGTLYPESQCPILETLRTGEPIRVDSDVYLHADGHAIPVICSVRPLRGSDGAAILGAVVSFLDNTERQALEREREQARAQAESMAQAKSAFLANMSHEIRTPMNAILGLTHLLQSNGVTPAQAERLGKIEIAGRHLLDLLNNILDLAKIDARKLTLSSTDFAPTALLEEVRLLIQPAADDKGLSVAVEGSDAPAWLRGDVMRLRQALLNYAGNAVKFTERGHIVLRARPLGEDGAGVSIRFEVEDSGIGIAPEVLPHLFAAFEQGPDSASFPQEGTGLGLAITRSLAQLMGGDAGVESTPGRGSCFWLRVQLALGEPVASAASDAASETAVEAALRASHGGTRVLLAEDNPVNREVALDLLQAVGLRVETAEDGQEALEKAGCGDYALLLMDVQMPRLNGLEATRAIRNLPGWRERPILAMTANAFQEDRENCLAAGMNDFVPKPVEPSDLYRLLLEWLPPAGTPADTGDVSSTPSPVESAPATHPALASLAQLPGLDLARGLEAIRGQPDKYLRLLRRFAAHHRDDAATLTRCLEAGDVHAARRIIHALKGVAGTVGAVDIAASAAALDDLLHQPASADHKPYASLVDAIERALATLEIALAGCPASPARPEPAGAPCDDAHIHAVTDRLRSLLSANDTSAMPLYREQTALLREYLGERFPGFAECLERFDFEGALAALQPVEPPELR